MALIWLLMIGWWWPIHFAQPIRGQTYAVVVGIADYQALSYQNGDLQYADQDARQVVHFLHSKSGGRIADANIRLLVNQQATGANIQQAIRLFRQAGAGDRVILYFSGHGTADSFVPYDVVPGSSQRLVSHHAIKAAFYASAATTKLCIADACLSGSMAQSTRRANLAQRLVESVSTENNVAMLLASRSTEYAMETRRLRGGAFTHYLLKGLYGQADLNHDKVVTIRELHQYVTPQVRHTTRGRQAPVFFGRFPDDLAMSYL